MALQAQVADVPASRRRAPSSEEAKSALSCGWGTYRDTAVMMNHRLKPAFTGLTGIVFTTHGDSTYARVIQYTQGRRSGSWYTFNPQERVTEVVDYFPDSSHHKYWYDMNGRLQQFCHMRYCVDEAFDHIFGS